MIKASQRHVWADAHQEQFDRAETLIDKAIQDSEGEVVPVDISSATTSSRAVESLRRAYDEGGWDVTVASSGQIDPGVCLKLQVKSEAQR
jgi:hypothetical protein